MPLYEYRCPSCDQRMVEYRSVENRHDGPICACGTKTEKVISQPSMVVPDIQPYRSMIDGSMITSRSRHREHLRQHNCIEVGNELKELKPKAPDPPPGLKEAVIQAVHKARR